MKKLKILLLILSIFAFASIFITGETKAQNNNSPDLVETGHALSPGIPITGETKAQNNNGPELVETGHALSPGIPIAKKINSSEPRDTNRNCFNDAEIVTIGKIIKQNEALLKENESLNRTISLKDVQISYQKQLTSELQQKYNTKESELKDCEAAKVPVINTRHWYEIPLAVIGGVLTGILISKTLIK